MTTLFNNNTNEVGSPEKNETNQSGSVYESLVGEGKKYKDNEALAYSRMEADSFIETLKREQREKEAEIARLHKELQARISLEEAVGKITAGPGSNAQTSNQSNTNGGESNAIGGSGTKSGLSAEEAEKLFEKKLLQTQQELIQAQNLSAVDNELTKAWGPDKEIKLRTKAAELGLTEAQVDGIAKSNPKAFLAMFGLATIQESKPTNVTPPRTSAIGVSGVSKVTPGVKNQAYWDAMRQSNPSLYFSKDMTIQRHRAAQELGDSFFN